MSLLITINATPPKFALYLCSIHNIWLRENKITERKLIGRTYVRPYGQTRVTLQRDIKNSDVFILFYILDQFPTPLRPLCDLIDLVCLKSGWDRVKLVWSSFSSKDRVELVNWSELSDMHSISFRVGVVMESLRTSEWSS